MTWVCATSRKETRNNSYDSDGVLVWSTIHFYDDQGNYLGMEEYDGEGNLIQSYLNEG